MILINPEFIDQLERAKEQNTQSQFKEAMKTSPQLFERAEEIMKGQEAIKTPITTSDGELLVLYTTQPLTEEEKEVLSSFTAKEFHLFMRINNFNVQEI